MNAITTVETTGTSDQRCTFCQDQAYKWYRIIAIRDGKPVAVELWHTCRACDSGRYSMNKGAK